MGLEKQGVVSGITVERWVGGGPRSEGGRISSQSFKREKGKVLGKRGDEKQR